VKLRHWPGREHVSLEIIRIIAELPVSNTTYCFEKIKLAEQIRYYRNVCSRYDRYKIEVRVSIDIDATLRN